MEIERQNKSAEMSCSCLGGRNVYRQKTECSSGQKGEIKCWVSSLYNISRGRMILSVTHFFCFGFFIYYYFVCYPQPIFFFFGDFGVFSILIDIFSMLNSGIFWEHHFSLQLFLFRTWSYMESRYALARRQTFLGTKSQCFRTRAGISATSPS